jgi:hypothetical protein
MCVFALAIVAYLFKIQFVERNHWMAMAEDIGTSIQTVEPARGNIFAKEDGKFHGMGWVRTWLGNGGVRQHQPRT